MITCSRKFHFCAGHRVLGHENKCRNAHGHNYVVFVEAGADKLDPLGRVIDFSVLKDRIGTWLDENWDHGFVVYRQDADMLQALTWLVDTKVAVVPFNPTAENMARYILEFVCPTVLRGTGVSAEKVTVWETENCYATATSY